MWFSAFTFGSFRFLIFTLNKERERVEKIVSKISKTFEEQKCANPKETVEAIQDCNKYKTMMNISYKPFLTLVQDDIQLRLKNLFIIFSNGFIDFYITADLNSKISLIAFIVIIQ